MRKLVAGLALSIFSVGPALADELEPFAVQVEYRVADGEWSAPETIECEALSRCNKYIDLMYKDEPMPVLFSVIDRGKENTVLAYVDPSGEIGRKLWLNARSRPLARIDGRSEMFSYTYSEKLSIKTYRETGRSHVEHDVADFRFTYLD